MVALRQSIVLTTCVLAPLLASGGMPAAAQGSGCRLEPGPSRTVAKIVDSETLQLDDGRQVRLIGALGPRASDIGAEAGTWPAEENARSALAALVLAKSITLAFGGDRTDRYERWQAHAFVGDGDDQRWVQGVMLAAGHARSYAISGNKACEAELLAHEKVARDQGLGLWAEAAYQVRKPWPARELLAFAPTFQIIEGRVMRVGSGREATYLNFGREARWDLSASIRHTDRDTLGKLGGDAKRLQGRRVEVRGWIEQRPGPAIDLSLAGQIILLDDGQDQGATADPLTPAAPQSGRSRRRASVQPGDVRPAADAERPAPQGTGRP